ncbi:Multidrug/Oligosaccharidyl-lipid/Polysaccharide (MOP) Flippase transporter, partial [Phytophthora megakarya]
SLLSSSLGPPPQISRGPASRAPRASLLWLRSSHTLSTDPIQNSSQKYVPFSDLYRI